MIKIADAVKRFDGFAALDGVSLSVPAGSVYGLVGPNGAGKSTLIRCLTGIYRQDEGELTIDGSPVWENEALKGRVAAIPDDWYYFPQASVRDMCRFYRGFYPNFSMERYEKLKEVFAKLGVTEIAALGETFDPNLHNAVMHIEDENLGENTIAQVFQSGFKLGDKVIRFAMVQVAN